MEKAGVTVSQASGEVASDSSETIGARVSVSEESGCPPGDNSMDISLIEGPPIVAVPEENQKVFRYPNKAPFYFGIDITHEEAVKRKAAREKRFGLEGEAAKDLESSIERREARAKRFGTKLVATDDGEPIKLVDSLPDIPDAKVRPEAVHLHGTNDMSTRDVFSYFQLYAPRNIEWVNDHSCNVVWEHQASASRALLELGRQPVALRSDYDSYIPPVVLATGSADQNQTGKGEMDQNHSKEKGVDWTQPREDSQNHTERSVLDQSRSESDLGETIQNQPADVNRGGSSQDKEGSKDTPVSRDLESSPMATEEEECVEGGQRKEKEEQRKESARMHPAVQWRYGGSHPKAKMLLLRWATELDVKQKGAAKNSMYYEKYGRPPLPATVIAARRKERRKGMEEEEEEEEEEGQAGNVKEMQDLRSRIGQKRTNQKDRANEVREEGEVMDDREEAMDTYQSSDDSFASLSKRPRTLYSDRMDATETVGKSERERVLARVGAHSERMGLVSSGGNDLRQALQQRKKRRNLKLRVGYHQRLVEEN